MKAASACCVTLAMFAICSCGDAAEENCSSLIQARTNVTRAKDESLANQRSMMNASLAPAPAFDWYAQFSTQNIKDIFRKYSCEDLISFELSAEEKYLPTAKKNLDKFKKSETRQSQSHECKATVGSAMTKVAVQSINPDFDSTEACASLLKGGSKCQEAQSGICTTFASVAYYMIAKYAHEKGIDTPRVELVDNGVTDASSTHVYLVVNRDETTRMKMKDAMPDADEWNKGAFIFDAWAASIGWDATFLPRYPPKGKFKAWLPLGIKPRKKMRFNLECPPGKWDNPDATRPKFTPSHS